MFGCLVEWQHVLVHTLLVPIDLTTCAICDGILCWLLYCTYVYSWQVLGKDILSTLTTRIRIIRTNNKNSITLSNAPPAWCWWWCKKSQRQQRNNGTSRRNVVCSVAVHCWYLLFGIDARKGHGSAPFTAPRKTRTNMMLVIIGMELLLRRWIIIGSPIMTSSNIRISITKNPLLQYYEYCTRARIVLRMWIHRVKPPLNYPFHSQYIYNAIHPTPSSPASITLPRPIYLIRG